MTYVLDVRLGITPQEGNEEAYRFQLPGDAFFVEHEPALGHHVEIRGLDPQHFLQVRIDTIGEANPDGVILISGFVWKDGEESYFYWERVLREVHGIAGLDRISTEEGESRITPVSLLNLACSFVDGIGDTCGQPASSLVRYPSGREEPRCDHDKGQTFVDGTGEIIEYVPNPLVAAGA